MQGKSRAGAQAHGFAPHLLIPSLDASDDVVGPRIYFIALLGFVVFYGLDIMVQPPRHTHPTKYHAYLAAFFLYDGLLMFTLGLELPPTPVLSLVFAFSLTSSPRRSLGL